MERDEALKAIREVAADFLSIDPAEIVEGSRFKEDLSADSLALIEISMALEERFGIELPEEDFDGVTTVGQAVDVVVRKVG